MFALRISRRVPRRELLRRLEAIEPQVAENRNVIAGLREAITHIRAYAGRPPEPGAEVVNLPRPGCQEVISAAGQEWVAVAGEGGEVDPRQLAAVLEGLGGHDERTPHHPYGQPA